MALSAVRKAGATECVLGSRRHVHCVRSTCTALEAPNQVRIRPGSTCGIMLGALSGSEGCTPVQVLYGEVMQYQLAAHVHPHVLLSLCAST